MRKRIFTMIAAAVIVVGSVLFAFLPWNGGMSFGYYLDTNGGAMLVTKDGSPISLGTPDVSAFVGLKKGEKLLVFHNGINDTYPASTTVTYIIRLGGASDDNIPLSTIVSLTGLGWLDAEE